MHSNQVDLSQYEDITIETDIVQLKNFLDEKNNWHSPTKYNVREFFPPEDDEMKKHYSPTYYNVTNLVISDIEDGIVICDGHLDDDTMLLDKLLIGKNTNLNIFLTSNIIMISIKKHRIAITFDSGYIQILY